MKKIEVVVLGAPNSGKSTLINLLVEKNICTISDKPHTTRERTLAILEKEDTQIVFLDTPGMDISKKSYAVKMKKEAMSASHIGDIQLFIFDGSKRPMQDILYFASLSKKPKIALVNKIDLVNRGRLLPFTSQLAEVFQTVFFVSAKNGEGCVQLINHLLSVAHQGEWDFENQKTTRNFRKIVEDKIREGVFKYMWNEIPYQSNIEITEMGKQNKVLTVRARIYCTSSHKPIIISKIKEIGMHARECIKGYTGEECHLFLQVKEKKT